MAGLREVACTSLRQGAAKWVDAVAKVSLPFEVASPTAPSERGRLTSKSETDVAPVRHALHLLDGRQAAGDDPQRSKGELNTH